jgi:hypothetical protein
VVTLCSIPASLSTAGVGASSPWVVLLPVVQHERAVSLIKKPNRHKGFDKSAVSALPVGRQFNVLDRHSAKSAIATV